MRNTTLNPGSPFAPIFGSILASSSMFALVAIMMPSVSAMM